MSKYKMVDGEYTLWTLEYISMSTRGFHPYIARKICMRVLIDETAELVAKSYLRAGKLPGPWDKLRESTGQEVSEYFRQHPERMATESTDTRFNKYAKTET